MTTHIPYGSPLARKAYSVGLFNKIQTGRGFMNLLSGEMPKEGQFGARAKGQTSPGMPIVKAADLQKSAGDTISVDLFNELKGKPTMGDRKIAGKMMSLSSSSMDVTINQYRGGADTGGRMTQQRTVHNLRSIVMAGMQGWGQRLEDQISLVHLAGARGDQNHDSWVVPLASDAEFSDIMVNTVKAPTKNRQFYAGAGTLPSDLATTDPLTLQDVERIVASLRESDTAIQSIKIDTDERAWSDPLWVMFVSERVWLYLKSRTSQTAWRTAVQNAYDRKSAGIKHPLFDSFETIMWDGLLIKRMGRYAIRFNAGTSVTYDTGGADGKTYTEASAAAAVATDRSIIVGAQALAKVYGRHQNSDYYYDWSEEKVDHGNAVEIVAAMMGGCGKLRFKVGDTDTDLGVAVVDSYAPEPNSGAGKALIAT